MEEIWKPIPGFGYEISNCGRVRNANGRILRNQPQGSGYLVVHLSRGSRASRKSRLVHRLVAAAFCGKGEEVNHINGDKMDNRAINLEWVDRKGNMAHAKALGLLPVRPANSRAVRGVHKETGEVIEFPTQMAAEVFLSGRKSSAINHCFTGRKKSAYGYRWSLV